jgi:alanine racemase
LIEIRGVSVKRAWLEIDFAKLKNNYEIAKRLVKGKEILGVVKADGYGCGDVAIAKELTKLGVKIFGVACLKEGVKLRKNGIQGEILVFGALNYDEYEEAFNNNLQLSITRYEDLEYIEKNNFCNPKVHIKIDTGMGRIGFTNIKRQDVLDMIEKFKKTEIIGIYSHFSSSDEYTQELYTVQQINKFKEYEDIKELKYRHIQNSAGIIDHDSLCGGNLARAGIMLYGYTDLHNGLETITKLKARIAHLKIVEEDSYISYGREGFVKKGGMVATVSIGYADGYQRRFTNKGIMHIDGVPCKVLGKVCMDVTMIEIPDCIKEKVKLGMEVEVLGKHVMNQLKNAEISPYEYLVQISGRVDRVYI